MMREDEKNCGYLEPWTRGPLINVDWLTKVRNFCPKFALVRFETFLSSLSSYETLEDEFI